MKSPRREEVDELREIYGFEPVCKWTVHLYLSHQKRWDSDGYFTSREDAVEHLNGLREHNMTARLRRCEETAVFTELEVG